MIPNKTISILSTILILFLSGVFVYAGVVKLLDPWAFARSIKSYRLPLGLLAVVGTFVLPPLEILAGMMLFWKKTRGGALLMLGALTVLFLLALTQAAVRGFPLDCGCFGQTLPGGGNPHIAIARDLLFLTTIVVLHSLTTKKLLPVNNFIVVP